MSSTDLTGAELIEMFEGLVDDSLDETLAYQQLNAADQLLQDRRNWAILQDYDGSQTASPSDTYLTMKTLPATYGKTTKLYVGSDIIPWREVGFNQRERYQGRTRFWYKDMKNAQFALMAPPGSAATIKHFFKYVPTIISEATSPVWPNRFRQVLPYLMAQKWFAIDQGDKVRSWDDRWTIFLNEILAQMDAWDFGLQQESAMNEGIEENYSGYPDRTDPYDN